MRFGDLALGSPVFRSKRPSAFWAGLVFHLVIALIFLAAGVFAICTGLLPDKSN